MDTGSTLPLGPWFTSVAVVAMHASLLGIPILPRAEQMHAITMRAHAPNDANPCTCKLPLRNPAPTPAPSPPSPPLPKNLNRSSYSEWIRSTVAQCLAASGQPCLCLHYSFACSFGLHRGQILVEERGREITVGTALLSRPSIPLFAQALA